MNAVSILDNNGFTGLQAVYQRKLTTAKQAVRLIKSGDWVDYGWCTGHPVELDRALADRYEELHDVNMRGGIFLWQPEISKVPDAKEHFTWNSWHMSGVERKFIEQGMAYYSPMRYSELSRYYLENVERVDVAMFQVAPMDRFGYFNFGPNVSHMPEVCKRAEKIIVEVNENMPYCLGKESAGIHISQVDLIVEGDNPPIAELPSSPVSDVDRQVAQLIVEDISNGACLQIGVGGMPNAVGSLIADSDLKDLGVHTEMYVDAFVDIAQAGKITGRKKQLNRGVQTYAFAAGSQKLYDYIDNNPEMYCTSIGYTNDARVIAQQDNFISINNAVEVDLFGQVNSESSGIRHISGSGGQQDFVLGAYLSQGGKSFICCSSTFTAKDGSQRSRIVPTLNSGSVVTDTRTNVQYVVTEFGKVNLKGLSSWQRAEALISIAHPQFQDELVKQAEKAKIWRKINRRV